MLIKIQTNVKTLVQNFVNPSEYFIPTAQAVSNSPATNNISHAFILMIFCAALKYKNLRREKF